MLKRIYIVPPLAFARVGPSSHPCDAFLWGANDVTPRGSGTTTLIPMETLEIAADGSLSYYKPSQILLRDEEGIRPVCPFFELHAQWVESDGSLQNGPLTEALLARCGCTTEDIEWEVELANLKAFHYTHELGDRIESRAKVAANNYQRISLKGVSPTVAAEPLIREKHPITMGWMQVAKSDDSFPELRMRFYAPPGAIYGPEDISERMKLDFELEVDGSKPNAEWSGFKLPTEHQIVNPQASWPKYVPTQAKLGPFFGNDNRNTPSGLLAAPYSSIPVDGNPQLPRSLGLVDDVSDGFVRCTLRVREMVLEAVSRLVVGPPDFAPANRPPISLADNLADREDRATPRSKKWSQDELGELVADILERALETSDLMHRDYQNWRSVRTNINEHSEAGLRSPFDTDDVRAMLWPVPDAKLINEGKVSAMALSESGTWKHRRYATLEYLEDRFRENPGLFEQIVRRPADPNPYFDRRMPALMRGSDGRPLHLTRRQWEIFRQWIEVLQAKTSAAGMPPERN
jgi:hypothetical protein